MPSSLRDRYAVNLTSDLEADPEAQGRSTDDKVFRIALIGDFSGRAQRDPIAKRRPMILDRDNFDSVLRRLKLVIDSPVGDIEINEMDDFHPDRVYTHVEFDSIRDLRKRLANPNTFNEAAQQLLGHAPAPPPRPQSGADILAGIIGGTPTGAAPKRAEPVDDLRAFIERAVAPYLVPGEHPRAAELIGRVDEAASAVMRAVLHDAAFRRIETAWRSAWLLVQRLETGADLKIYLYDITKQELAEESQAVHDLLVRRSDPFAVLVSMDAFGSDDVRLLRVMGAIAQKANAPWLAEADPSLIGAPEWSAFRSTAEARWIGLALPRVLLRMPYGKNFDPCETFPFEEVSGKPDVKQMLFGSPAVFCALLMGQSHQENRAAREIGDLPFYTYKEDDETVMFSPVEVELTGETAEALLDSGIMPIMGIRNRDAARVLRFQSAAEPPTSLPGQ